MKRVVPDRAGGYPARVRAASVLRTPLLAVLALTIVGGFAAASDEAAFKDIETRWRKLAKNKDEDANRERRKLLLRVFDFLDQKAARKLLRDAYGDEPTPDGRIAAVQVLAASGDPKDAEFLLGAFRKERSPGPVIALGQGLSFTAEASAPAMSAWAAAQAAKQKGDAQRSLLEGAAELGDPSALPALRALAGKLDEAGEFERLIALGSCGRAAAVPDLEKASLAPDADIRLGATLGLARTGGPGAPPAPTALPGLVAMAADLSPNVVEAAARGLAAAKHAPAVKPLADALTRAPLRTREVLRAALREITGRDAGHDPEAWQKDGGTAPAPKLPSFAGIDVATDHVALLLDLSRSMDDSGRLAAAKRVLHDFLGTLPEDAVFGVVAVGRTPVPLSDKLSTGATGSASAAAFLDKQLTAGGCDLREGLRYVLRQWPSIDTIVLATDSQPWGETADDTPLAVLQELRRDNRMRRVRLHIAFTAPGGRFAESEPKAEEYEDRKELLKLLAESADGKLVVQE